MCRFLMRARLRTLVIAGSTLIVAVPLIGVAALFHFSEQLLHPPRPTLTHDREGEPLIRDGKPPAVIGVVIDDGDRNDRGEPSGVRITATTLTPAREAGIEAGDLIASAGGEEILEPEDLRAVLRDRSPGETLPIEVHRAGGGTLRMEVALSPLPLMPGDLALEHDDVEFTGGDGLTARGWFVPTTGAPLGSVVLLHGNASSRRSGLLAARELHAAGLAVLLFDFTGRGDSDGRTCTYGWRERADALGAARLASALVPDLPVALYGRSLGASTALLAASETRGVNVDAVIADSPFASLAELIAARRSDMGVPAWPFEGALFAILRWRGGFDPRDLDITRAASRVTVPVLFLHGTEDSVVPPEHSERLANRLAGPWEIELLEGLGHNGERPPEVTDRVVSFLVKTMGGPC
jgi:alpha-beta hydrolase superfamily lysophospholipase